MVVQNNVPAINSHRNLLINNSNLSRNLERLSSGFRINRAGDDAAGLAISERMRTQIRGLAMAEQNTTNGINLIQTAEGGLNETHALLQRMRELAVMSSNATFQPSDREQIHLEVVALIDEIDRIASSTHYNRINLLDGSFGSVRVLAEQTADDMQFAQVDQILGGIDGTSLRIAHADGDDDPAARVAGWSNQLAGVTDLNARITVTEMPGVMAGMSAGANTGAVGGAGGRNFVIALQVGDNTFRGFEGDGDTIEFRNADGYIVASINVDQGELNAGVVSGIRINGADRGVTGERGADSGAFDHAMVVERASLTNQLSFQIGANGGLDQRASLFVASMNSTSLGGSDINGNSWTIRDLGMNLAWDVNDGFVTDDLRVLDPLTGMTAAAATEAASGVSILTQAGSNNAIAIIDAAIDQVSAQRAGLGALQNRMESTLNSLGVARENLTAAESTIRDVDMAAEMMRFTQNSILTQASQAMLAQANQIPQGVLQLLR